MDGICSMVAELVQDYEVMDAAEVLFPSGRPVVGTSTVPEATAPA